MLLFPQSSEMQSFSSGLAKVSSTLLQVISVYTPCKPYIRLLLAAFNAADHVLQFRLHRDAKLVCQRVAIKHLWHNCRNLSVSNGAAKVHLDRRLVINKNLSLEKPGVANIFLKEYMHPDGIPRLDLPFELRAPDPGKYRLLSGQCGSML